MSKTDMEKVSEEQVNIKPKKVSKKRWIWLSLCIGLISTAIIVAIVVSLSLRDDPDPIPTPTPAYEGVHYDNWPTSWSWATVAPMVRYSIDIEKDNYDYNEEFIIKYTIYRVDEYDVEDRNNLNVKIISDKFEFLSPTEYHFDLETDISTYGNILSFGDEEKSTIYPIEMELKVKAKEPSENIETINIDNISFLVGLPLKEDYKNSIIHGYDDIGEIYKFFTIEFTKNFEWIHRLYFSNDDFGILLIDDGKWHEYYSKSLKKISSISDYNMTPYKSLNRLYEKGLITKDDYLDRLIDYLSDYKTHAYIYVNGVFFHEGTFHGVVESNRSYMEYSSKNIRVYFKWRPEYFELYEKYFRKYVWQQPIDTKNLAKELVEILYERKIISFEQYTAELQLIEEEGVPNVSWCGEYEKSLIPFEVPMELYYDYIVE